MRAPSKKVIYVTFSRGMQHNTASTSEHTHTWGNIAMKVSLSVLTLTSPPVSSSRLHWHKYLLFPTLRSSGLLVAAAHSLSQTHGTPRTGRCNENKPARCCPSEPRRKTSINVQHRVSRERHKSTNVSLLGLFRHREVECKRRALLPSSSKLSAHIDLLKHLAVN